MRVSSIESSVNTTYKWLDEFKEFGHFRDESQCYSILRIVLHSLRDRLPPDLAAHLAAQFPMILKGVYYDGWDPSKPISRAETLEEFIEPISREMGNLNVDIRQAVQDCMKFIYSKLDGNIAEKVMNALPIKLRKSFLN
ncbi:DUF2267 domain-containing protein [Legionella sp. CNM-1927-20]|uniref:DUF2267 domain-containing protein n=1 Tax=Legionella sp. CNM-1927-20 TaxID=3422221 RepID=UPI00403AF2E0